MTCPGCAVECWDFPACPEFVDRDDAAMAEAAGLAFAGADAQVDPAAIAATHEHLKASRRTNANRARYGGGGLFDEIEKSA